MSPRVTSAEEPYGGNLLVRLWRGVGTGNRPTYSTKPFSTPRLRPLAPAPPPASRTPRASELMLGARAPGLLLDRLLAQTQPQFKVRSYQHGDVAALKAMADRLDLVTLIDRHLPASRRAFSVGTTLLLAAINRAVWPCSKRSWASWAQRTSIPHLFALQPAALTSQHFWDQMDVVSQSALEAIEQELTRKVIHDFDLTLDTPGALRPVPFKKR